MKVNSPPLLLNNSLCSSCEHMSRIQTTRGNTFIMCNLSKTDKNFPKYPKLPVLQCRGYEMSPEESPAADIQKK